MNWINLFFFRVKIYGASLEAKGFHSVFNFGFIFLFSIFFFYILVVVLILQNVHLLDITGKSDPYLVIYKELPPFQDPPYFTPVYKTEIIKQNLNPSWQVYFQ